MTQKRRQLTLFIPAPASDPIEKIRREFNPAQYALIKSHVTLCREDELEQPEKVILNLTRLRHGRITIDFGAPVRFSGGKGVLLPAIGTHESFQQLRERILQGIIEKPRTYEPHITLMHPRNAACTDELFEQIERCVFPDKIEFRKISLIEQETGKKWNVLEEFELINGKEKFIAPDKFHPPPAG